MMGTGMHRSKGTTLNREARHRLASLDFEPTVFVTERESSRQRSLRDEGPANTLYSPGRAAIRCYPCRRPKDNSDRSSGHFFDSPGASFTRCMLPAACSLPWP